MVIEKLQLESWHRNWDICMSSCSTHSTRLLKQAASGGCSGWHKWVTAQFWRPILLCKTCQSTSMQAVSSQGHPRSCSWREVLQSLDKQLWMSCRGGRETDTSLTDFTLSFVGKEPYMLMRPAISLFIFLFPTCPSGTLRSGKSASASPNLCLQ